MYTKGIGSIVGLVMLVTMCIGLTLDGPSLAAKVTNNPPVEEDWGEYTVLARYDHTYQGHLVVMKHQNGTRIFGALENSNDYCLAVGDVVKVRKVKGIFILEPPYKNCIFSHLGQ